MPTVAPPPMTNAEAYDDTCRRVYEGRRGLYDLSGIDPSTQNTRVVVSEIRFAQCVSEFRNRIEKLNEIVVIEGRMKIYGMPFEADPRLLNGEIRFRAEVPL